MSVVRLTQRIAAPLEELWDAVATTSGLALWQADEVVGSVAVGASLELKFHALDAAVSLDVVELVAGERVVYAAGKSRLQIEVRPGELTLVHAGLTEGDEEAGTRSSWMLALATLAASLERFRGRARFVHAARGLVRATPALCHAYFTHPAALGCWLAEAGELGPVGAEVRLRFAWGPVATGRILVHVPERDVLFSWQEADAVVALRTLPSPRARDERVVLVTVSRWGEQLDPAAQAGLASAVRRLELALASRGAA